MARKHSQSRPSGRRRSTRGGGKNNPTTKILAIVGGVVGLALIGWIIYKYIIVPPDYNRSHVDTFVAETYKTPNQLDDGAAVYIDMSDGMLSAYDSEQSKTNLQAIVNKFANNRAIEFYGLSDGKISKMDKTHTELYNYVLSPASYKRQWSAPIEETLSTIVKKNQPALLMTDFEEYNNGRIQQAAYAKANFIEWLAKGNNITFYKWDFIENGQQKHMFYAVFDDNYNRLNSLVEDALAKVDPTIEKYVLGGYKFAYPMQTKYLSVKQGGNYHKNNGKGIDAVTNVLEDGSAEAYCSYSKNVASATGVQGEFLPLDCLAGPVAEYYPVGVKWSDAIANAKGFQESGVRPENIYTHLLSDLYIDFGAQDGYEINGVEVRVFDMHDLMMHFAKTGELDTKIETPEMPEVFTASMQDDPRHLGMKEIFVDFDERFEKSNGMLPGVKTNDNLLRANIVISKAAVDLSKVDDFFGWPGNPSLANSVRETLSAATSSPVGRVLYTYYIRSLAK